MAQSEPRGGDLNDALDAFHEAGHAVVATVLGHPPPYVELTNETPEALRGAGVVKGFTAMPPEILNWQDAPSEDHARILLEKKCIIWVAGGLAERRLKGDIDRHVDGHDCRAALDDLALHCDSDDEIHARYRLAVIRARNLLAEDYVWAACKALAGALVVHGRIERAAIVELVDEATRAHQSRKALPKRRYVTVTCGRVVVCRAEHVPSMRRLISREGASSKWPERVTIDGYPFEPVPDWEPEAVECFNADTGGYAIMFRKLYRDGKPVKAVGRKAKRLRDKIARLVG